MSITEREEPGTMTSDVDPDGAIRTLISDGHALPSAWYTSEKISTSNSGWSFAGRGSASVIAAR